ncbi:MAG: ABC transporter ATP-binding protein [Mycoplasmataceae bacterium]|nr:ABC transporter ATP-binding protein [Mycoplasmataceae bacterium]
MKKILSVKDLNVMFLKNKHFLHAIRNINFDLYENEILSIVGESGSGKSVLSKALGCNLDENGFISSGEITYLNDNIKLNEITNFSLPKYVKTKIIKSLRKDISNLEKEYIKNKSIDIADEIAKLKNDLVYFINSFAKLKKQDVRKQLKNIRGKIFSYIFQDPSKTLNPLLTIGSQLIETIMLHNNVNYKDAKIKTIALLKKVGIADPENAIKKIPAEYSGGMRQRIVIASAIASNPKILIADEPTTALDVTIQNKILDLIFELKKELNLTIIFITHDLGVVSKISDRIFVMYAGNFVEWGNKKEIFLNPIHPYTWALLMAMPQFSNKNDKLFSLSGTPPQIENKWVGEPFANRNNYALEIDFKFEAPIFEISNTHYAKTWLLDSRAPKFSKPKELEKIIAELKKIIK